MSKYLLSPIDHSALWHLSHFLSLLLVLVSLLTGLRIATMDHPWLLMFSALLPQGYMHIWHLGAAIFWVILIITCLIYRLFYFHTPSLKMQRNWKNTSFLSIWGYSAMVSSVVSGVFLYFTFLSFIPWLKIHFISALALLVFLLLHIILKVLDHGIGVFKSFFPARETFTLYLTGMVGFFVAGGLLLFLLSYYEYSKLFVSRMAEDSLMTIDGKANEEIWKQTEKITLYTYGGANFYEGQSHIEIQAVENNSEIFFLVRWEDPTQSLTHLPLIKTQAGWEVVASGVYRFDEQEYYEDKLALLFSTTREAGAAATAHLGPQPLADKMPNWHKRGYHYTHDGSIRDLWQWKAVRSNDMYQADDEFFGAPATQRDGDRRYVAGYLPDPKESGGVAMNWQWYKRGTVVPKRLPAKTNALASYFLHKSEKILRWSIPWYHYPVYKKTLDHFPLGSILPSVLYTSNAYEGDRGHVRARALWKNGWWTLELVRSLNTGSPYDLEIKDGIYLWVAAFDHAQTLHSRHIHPIQLCFEGIDNE